MIPKGTAHLLYSGQEENSQVKHGISKKDRFVSVQLGQSSTSNARECFTDISVICLNLGEIVNTSQTVTL